MILSSSSPRDNDRYRCIAIISVRDEQDPITGYLSAIDAAARLPRLL
jgi:hypothetical protein